MISFKLHINFTKKSFLVRYTVLVSTLFFVLNAYFLFASDSSIPSKFHALDLPTIFIEENFAMTLVCK